MSGYEKEQARLFELAVKSGRAFFEALKNKEIPEDVLKSEVPIGVTLLMAGPSSDFIIGRVFENAMPDAHDEVVKNDKGDKELRLSIAKTKYLQANCVVLK
jgi:hypothetical protein